MSPFAGQGVNLALADAVDLADAMAVGDTGTAIAAYESKMAERAQAAAQASAQGLRSVFDPDDALPVLEHDRERMNC